MSVSGEKMTAVLVTHDHAEAMSIADRIGVMRRGRIEQVGVPAELYQRPQTAFVGEFLGTNGLFGKIIHKDDSSGEKPDDLVRRSR
ncbi:MAG: hypothetical protein OEN01_04945 [Candidatus Krumholzibacteria bacterium]|nr:hypothetical protein [Candidatus Krumholzibacteria bacterium]